jgi:hypothetical protein
MILLVGATGVVRGAYPTVAINGGDELWYVELPAPRGEALHAGKYYDAGQAASRTGRAPGLDIYVNGRRCNESKGTLTIRE